MDHFFINEYQMLQSYFFDPVNLKHKYQLYDLSYPKKESSFKRIKSMLGFNGGFGRDYIRFFQWLENEKISVEDAIAVIKNSRLIPKEAR